jgi:hypothetical protein
LLLLSHCQITATATVGITQGNRIQVRDARAHRLRPPITSAVTNAMIVCTTRLPASQIPDRPMAAQKVPSVSARV